MIYLLAPSLTILEYLGDGLDEAKDNPCKGLNTALNDRDPENASRKPESEILLEDSSKTRQLYDYEAAQTYQVI